MAVNDELEEKLFESAHNFLKQELLCTGLSAERADEILDQHINDQPNNAQKLGPSQYFERLLESAQNTVWKPSSIGGKIGGIQNIGPILGGFSTTKVLSDFKDWKEIYENISKEFPKANLSKKTMEKRENSDWGKFCKTIITSASYFEKFNYSDSFFDYAISFQENPKKIDKLPLDIEKNVFGIGYTLACDFLKEVGFTQYGKPDSQLRKILSELGLCPRNAAPIRVQEKIRQIASKSSKTPYQIDKALWLIGSGRFYKRGFQLTADDRIARFIVQLE